MTKSIGETSKSTKRAPAAPSPFEGLRHDIDRLFDDFGFRNWRNPFERAEFEVEPFWRGEPGGSRALAVDMADTGGAFEITVELPGMSEEDVEVKLTGDVLTIAGEKSEKSQETEKDYFLSERHYGAFQRAFRLPASVMADAITAEFSNGVLKLTLPKSPQTRQKEKTISIKTA